MEFNTLSKKGQNRTTCDLAWSCQCIRFSSTPLILNGPQIFQLPKQGWGNHNEILQFSFHEIYRQKLYYQVAGTWDRHHDGLCDFPTSLRSGHGTNFTRCSKYVERSNENWTSDSSSFQSFYGRHHHSRPIPNCCQ